MDSSLELMLFYILFPFLCILLFCFRRIPDPSALYSFSLLVHCLWWEFFFHIYYLLGDENLRSNLWMLAVLSANIFFFLLLTVFPPFKITVWLHGSWFADWNHFMHSFYYILCTREDHKKFSDGSWKVSQTFLLCNICTTFFL